MFQAVATLDLKIKQCNLIQSFRRDQEALVKKRFGKTEKSSENHSLHPQMTKKSDNKIQHVNPQHKVKQRSVIKITSVRDMEISNFPVSKSPGNCEHLYNQMSSESLWELEKVRARVATEPEY